MNAEVKLITVQFLINMELTKIYDEWRIQNKFMRPAIHFRLDVYMKFNMKCFSIVSIHNTVSFAREYCALLYGFFDVAILDDHGAVCNRHVYHIKTFESSCCSTSEV